MRRFLSGLMLIAVLSATGLALAADTPAASTGSVNSMTTAQKPDKTKKPKAAKPSRHHKKAAAEPAATKP